MPAIVNNEPAVPHNYWVRGILAELDIYKRVYKPHGYTHAPNAPAYDLKLLGPAGEYVQVKTLKNPDGAYQAMKKAVDDLVDLESPPNGLKLHILKKPGSGGNQLRNQLEIYIDSLNLERPFALDLDDFDLP